MRKKIGNISRIIALTVFAFSVVFGIIYLKLTVPSERELWRITDNNLSDPIIVKNFLLFKGEKGDYPRVCEHIHAVDKNTGEEVWSSESFTDQYCDPSWGPMYTAIILLSEKHDVIFVSSSYWTTDDEQNYVLYALSSSNGELLWKVDGYAGYPYDGYYPLEYSSIDTNNIYVASKEGSFSAIDNRTGQEVWKRKIPNVDYAEDILIEYNNQIVYYYYSGNHSLTAFDARDGNQIWEVSNLNYIHHIVLSDQLAYLVFWSDNQSDSPSYITAMDTMNGKQVWKLPLGQKSGPWAEIMGNKVYIVSHGSDGLFDGFKTPCSPGFVNENTGCSLAVVNKNTGELIWQFNEDYSHGNINYFVRDNVVYIGTHDGLIFALDEQTGKIIWQTKASGVPYYFHVEDSTLVVVYEQKYASAFDTKTGKQKWLLDVGMDVLWYPPEFIIARDEVIYIAGAANRRVYAIDVGTGKIFWSWNHYHPRDKAYMLKALDNDVLYVDQYRRFLGYDWFFALKTKP